MKFENKSFCLIYIFLGIWTSFQSIIKSQSIKKFRPNQNKKYRSFQYSTFIYIEIGSLILRLDEIRFACTNGIQFLKFSFHRNIAFQSKYFARNNSNHRERFIRDRNAKFFRKSTRFLHLCYFENFLWRIYKFSISKTFVGFSIGSAYTNCKVSLLKYSQRSEPICAYFVRFYSWLNPLLYEILAGFANGFREYRRRRKTLQPAQYSTHSIRISINIQRSKRGLVKSIYTRIRTAFI